jgi:hypothetical protein
MEGIKDGCADRDGCKHLEGIHNGFDERDGIEDGIKMARRQVHIQVQIHDNL